MILGIDIGGTKSAAVLGSADGTLHDRIEIPSEAALGPSSLLDRLVSITRQLLDRRSLGSDDLDGIGISCGGPLDTKLGLVFDPPNLPGWHAVPVRAHFESAFPGVDVLIENDANATALAEHRFGAGRGTSNMVFMTMGTGVGAGLILDGRLYRGTNDLAGELGHQVIVLDGPLCPCGKRGCLEALVSGPSVARIAREKFGYGRGRALLERAGGSADQVTARDVIEGARDGDPLCIDALSEVGFYLGVGLANIVQILNPERIVLGTLAVHAGDLLLNPARESLAEHAWKRSRDVCQIVPAELGDRAQDLAAISLVAAKMG